MMHLYHLLCTSGVFYVLSVAAVVVAGVVADQSRSPTKKENMQMVGPKHIMMHREDESKESKNLMILP